MYLLHTNHRRQGRIHAARSVGHANLGALVLTCRLPRLQRANHARVPASPRPCLLLLVQRIEHVQPPLLGRRLPLRLNVTQQIRPQPLPYVMAIVITNSIVGLHVDEWLRCGGAGEFDALEPVVFGE